MNNKIYVIRKVAYEYSDEYHFSVGFRGIKSIYQDENEAKEQLKVLECKAFRKWDLGDIEQFSGCNQDFENQRKSLNKYLEKTLGKSLFCESEYGDIYIESETFLPEEITDEQIMQIRQISGVRFYELAEFEEDIAFYAMWLNRENRFCTQRDIKEPNHLPYFPDVCCFFTTYEEALEGLGDVFNNFEFLLEGKLEELSQQPSMLKSLIRQSQSLTYNAEKNILEVKCFYYFLDEFTSLNALLKDPIFEIKSIPLAEAKKHLKVDLL